MTSHLSFDPKLQNQLLIVDRCRTIQSQYGSMKTGFSIFVKNVVCPPVTDLDDFPLREITDGRQSITKGCAQWELNVNNVTKMDDLGKQIQCSVCGLQIRIRLQFCFTDWDSHRSTFKHREVVKEIESKGITKMTTYF